ncbi:MAG: PfkB family carbohydrate kinase, partial [Anaerolineae bacterium]|nr:PfkB family carbohydrate kinase [Anaerolineae bacterium]
DDIIDPNGRSFMGVLGGGGSHAVAGMRVWSDKTALAAVIGQNFPATAWQRLTTLAQTGGIIERSVPQPRAWQLFETDGTRNEVFRTNFDLFQQIPIRPEEYPAGFAPAKGIYLQTPTAASADAWVDRLRALNPRTVLLWEPWEILYAQQNLAAFRRVASRFDIVSPNTMEAGWLLEETDPDRQAERFFACGVRCLALRLGAEGSLVGTANNLHHVPALEVPVVDETGAGNSYCGGFVVGYVQSGGDPLTAGRYGTVSATFALAQLGLAELGEETYDLAVTRLNLFSTTPANTS